MLSPRGRSTEALALALLTAAAFLALRVPVASIIVQLCAPSVGLWAAVNGDVHRLLQIYVLTTVASLTLAIVAAARMMLDGKQGETGPSSVSEVVAASINIEGVLASLPSSAAKNQRRVILTSDSILDYRTGVEGTPPSYCLQDVTMVVVRTEMRAVRALLALPAAVMAGLMIWWAYLRHDVESVIGAFFPVTLFTLMTIAALYYSRRRVISVIPVGQIIVEQGEGVSSSDVRDFVEKANTAIAARSKR
jgi:uncharacterized membrane protein